MKFSLKKQLLLAALCVLATTISFGQSSGGSNKSDKKGHPQGQENRMDKESDWMKQNLKLTDDQYAKVTALNKEYAGKMRPESPKEKPSEKPSGKPEDRQMKKPSAEDQKKMEQWQAEKELKLKSILTPQQWKDYQTKKKDMPKGSEHKHPEGKPKE